MASRVALRGFPGSPLAGTPRACWILVIVRLDGSPPPPARFSEITSCDSFSGSVVTCCLPATLACCSGVFAIEELLGAAAAAAAAASPGFEETTEGAPLAALLIFASIDAGEHCTR